jgi:hypothetical protein
MPERLDRVQIATRGGDVVIPWATRDEILDLLRKRSDALPIVRAFEAVGATSPVELDANGKALLVEALGSWIDRADEGKLPTGLTALRAALVDDLAAAGYWNR